MPRSHPVDMTHERARENEEYLQRGAKFSFTFFHLARRLARI
jgi:hypothetical protein